MSGVQGRLVESFAVPAAMQAVMMHGRDVGREVAAETLRRMIGGRAALIGQGERDEVQLLRDILSSVVRVPEPGPNGTVHVERTVGQILATEVRPNGRPGLETPNSPAVATVAAMGVRVYHPRGGDPARIFIADDIVRRQLLRDTRWATSRIDQLLSRLTAPHPAYLPGCPASLPRWRPTCRSRWVSRSTANVDLAACWGYKGELCLGDQCGRPANSG